MALLPLRICVATRDGQSERIAQHVSRRLTGFGIAAELYNLPSALLTPGVLAASSMIVVIAAVRYGRHLPEAEAFLADYKMIDPPPLLAFASVNLTARKDGRHSARDNPYVRKILHRNGLTPAVACAIAGRLNYPRYKWIDRQVIRFIMAMTGGPTDGVSNIEFTRWNQVDEFAQAIATVVNPHQDGVQAAGL